MVEINSSVGNNLTSSFISKHTLQAAESIKSTDPKPLPIAGNVQISSEAQYLFEMDIYLQSLDTEHQQQAINFLSKSDDPLHVKALKHFNDSAELRNTFTDDVVQSITAQREAAEATAVKSSTRDPSLGPEIAVIPAGTNIYRLDGKTNYFPEQRDTINSALRAQLDELQASSPSNLNIQENANIFGTVRNALYTSENIQLSFDDVLNFNYTLEKAHKTINQTNAPNDIKSKLNDILDQSVKYQSSKQTKYIADIQKYATDGRVGGEVQENIRMATASQAYNTDLQSTLKATNISVLDAGSAMKNLLSRHTDLIRFSPEKINEALSFYKRDFDTFQDFVKNGYIPDTSSSFEFDTAALTEGHNIALQVIKDIQNYVSKEK